MEGTIDIEPRLQSRPIERRLALVVAAIGIAFTICALVLGFAARAAGSRFTATAIGDVGAFSFSATLIVLGFILRSRRPDHPIGWLFLAFGATASISAVAWGGMLLSAVPGGDPRFGAIISLIGAVSSGTVWAYLIAAIVIRFPTGSPESPREAAILRWAPVVLLISALAIVIRPGPIVIYPAFENPITTPAAWRDALLVLTSIAIAAGILPAVSAGIAMVDRYRRSASVQRLQLRWFAFGGAVLISASIVYIVIGVLLASDNPLIREITYATFVFAGCGLPIAVFVAITRYRLYEIDTIIGRTFAYGALTAILAGLYSASVRLFNAMFVALTGQESEAALVLTTLVLATTFTPIKTYLERLAARRFPAATNAEAASAQPDPLATASTAPDEDLDARIEAIARRVAREVLAEQAPGTGGR